MISKIGVIVWGIRNGFKNNWLSANVDTQVYQQFTDDMRQICNSTVDKFFSIEKIEDFTVLSIFNPNTKDHVQRKAYIALSIVIPNGYTIVGNPIDALEKMMQTYEVKQGNAMVNMLSTDDLMNHLVNLSIIHNPNTVPQARAKLGVFEFSDSSEILPHFNDPSIYAFKKVFFITGQNVALERMSGIERVHMFTKPLFLSMSGFDPKIYTVNINDQPVSAPRSQVKQNDIVQFIEIKTKRGKQLQVGSQDVSISMHELFPPIVKPPKPPSSPGVNKSKLIALVGILVVFIGVGAYFFLQSSEQPFVDDPAPVAKDFSVTYDFEELTFDNFPVSADSLMWFVVFRQNNDSIPLDSLSINKPKVRTNKLTVNDSLLTMRYSLPDSNYSTILRVEFIIPVKYTVKSGESLSKIAERFGIKKDSLMKWNEILEENAIKKGQVLRLEYKSPEKVDVESSSSSLLEKSIDEKPTLPEPKEVIPPALEKKKEAKPEDLTQLKKDIDKLIKELSDNKVDVTGFKSEKEGCSDKDCFQILKDKLEKEKLKI